MVSVATKKEITSRELRRGPTEHENASVNYFLQHLKISSARTIFERIQLALAFKRT